MWNACRRLNIGRDSGSSWRCGSHVPKRGHGKFDSAVEAPRGESRKKTPVGNSRAGESAEPIFSQSDCGVDRRCVERGRSPLQAQSSSIAPAKPTRSQTNIIRRATAHFEGAYAWHANTGFFGGFLSSRALVQLFLTVLMALAGSLECFKT